MTGEQERNPRDVQKSILILVFFIDGTHQGRRGWEDLVDENKNGFLRAELDSFADDIDELADGQVGWHQILFLVDRRNI